MKHILSLILLVVSLNSQAFFFDPKVETVDRKTNETIKIPIDVHKVDKPAPTIIYGHNCSGVSESYHTNMIWVRTIKGWGYNVVIPDSHGPRGFGNICAKTSDVPAYNRAFDAISVAEWVKKQPWHEGKIGFIGYSHGATQGEFLSKMPDTGISAIVSYYPLCQRIRAQNYVPVQIHIGTADTWTPSEKCEPYIGRDNYDVNIYQGATHSFERPVPTRMYGKHRLAYDSAAAQQAERKTQEFFDKNLK
jgi:dienelactone hydrolase